MGSINNITEENCRTCLSYFNKDNGKCSLANCFAINSDNSRLELMKNVMTTCSITEKFSGKESARGYAWGVSKLKLKRRRDVQFLNLKQSSPQINKFLKLFSSKKVQEMSGEIFICMSCVAEIDQMLNFLQKCIHSEAILKQASEVKTEITSVWTDEAQKGNENKLQPKVEIKIENLYQSGEHNTLNGFDSDAVFDTTSEPSNESNNNKNPKQEYRECHNTFPSALSLAFHKYKHSGFKLHTCVICQENFQTLQLIKKHMAAKHSNDYHQQYMCRHCSNVFTSKYHLNLHKLKIHKIKKYSCSACKRTFATVSSLKFHQNIHLGQQMYSCTSCEKSFVSASVLREHKNNFHSDLKLFRCHCGTSFNRKKKLELHVESVHEKKDKSRKYSCPDCDKKFHHPYSLKNHLNIHLGVKPFLCNACGSAFTALSNLTSHLRRIHSGDKQPTEKKYLCHTCGDSFARAAHLQRHTLRKHVPNAEKKHECPICKKKFLEKSDVTGHVKLHDDVKPFVCDQCSKCFRTAWRLQAHIKRVHLGLRPFECPTCSLKFKTKSHLEKHIRTHTGEKPFPCPHCSYTCAEKSNLKKHINIHLKTI